jgi:hypothetical protein
MVGVGRGKIVHDHCQMELVVPKVVGLFPVPEPSELKLVAGFSITQKNEDKTPVRGLLSPDFFKLEGLLVETDALLQIEDSKRPPTLSVALKSGKTSDNVLRLA